MVDTEVDKTIPLRGGAPELQLDEAERKLIENLRQLNNDKSLRHLAEVLIRNTNILIDRSQKYNQTKSSYDNTFGNGDAEMFINLNQNHERVSDIVHNGNNHLECEVAFVRFEEGQILEDNSNWSILWQCHRIERRENGKR